MLIRLCDLTSKKLNVVLYIDYGHAELCLKDDFFFFPLKRKKFVSKISVRFILLLADIFLLKRFSL